MFYCFIYDVNDSCQCNSFIIQAQNSLKKNYFPKKNFESKNKSLRLPTHAGALSHL